jgi:FeS assembly protein IscX
MCRKASLPTDRAAKFSGLPLQDERESETMPRELDWTDTEEIGIQLQEMFPDTDPYSVRFTDLHKWVVQLPGFVGDPAKSNEGILESIQTAWHEEYNDAKDA